MRKLIGITIAAFLSVSGMAEAQPTHEKIIIDTDIGDDIDDAFAVALALSSPEFYVKRVTSDAVSKLATSSISGSERASKPERH